MTNKLNKLKEYLTRFFLFVYKFLKQPSTIVGIIWVVGTIFGKDTDYINSFVMGINMFLGGTLIGFTKIKSTPE